MSKNTTTESALSLTRNLATRHHVTGLIKVSMGGLHTAAREFESAATLEPDNAAHWHALAQFHLSIEAPVAALQAFDAVLALNSDDIVALSQSYDALIGVGKFQEARQRLIRARELAPHDFLTLKRLADYRCSLRLVTGEEGKQTRQLIRAALQLVPEAADAQESLAYYHIFRGEWAKGVAVLQEFTKQHPNSPTGWYHYARCLFHTGLSHIAAEAILKAYALYKKDCEIYRALCEILPAAGRQSELQPLMEEMLLCFSERWSVWATVGQVLVESFKDIEQGCTISEQATQIQPRLADPWFRHGRVLALAGRHREAVEALEQGWRWLPKEGSSLQSVPAAVWLGESYQALGDDANSRGWWEEASGRAKELMDFNPGTAYYWQGRALEALKDVKGARQIYRTALRQHLLYPAHREVYEALKRLQILARRYSNQQV
ncbi:MAG: tetratricopeptide repeat protein [Xenococcaceae cyanobacterium]